MTRFLEIKLKQGQHDFKGDRVLQSFKRQAPFLPRNVRVRRLYAFDLPLSDTEWESLVTEFVDPVTEEAVLTHETDTPSLVYRVSFLPGVTDNEGKTALEMASAILGRSFESGEVYTSFLYLFDLDEKDFPDEEKAKEWGYRILANRLIEEVEVFTRPRWQKSSAFSIPVITARDHIRVEEIPVSGMDDEALAALDEARHLALDKRELDVIRDFFNRSDVRATRQKAGFSEAPLDAEIEMLAQTWSEHCKHKVFASLITYQDLSGETHRIDSLYKSMIKEPTKRAMKKCQHIVSVFEDNAGVLSFNDKYHICYKVETHNSPSALDPYGGAMTGIVGVNRDILGTGKGAVPHINVWGYCFASPEYDGPLPKGLLPPKRIREGVHKGVIDGGNQSGIPYGRGWELFDERYLGKPLVYCGTVGLLPRQLHGEDGAVKKILPGDLIVMAGGRIGKDGIHGATFSSRQLDETSPVQAVQIGDPLTQKKMTDFLIEARDRGLYRSITDNGAGGLASSVGEMARETGGAWLDLARAPLKYHGLQPWEILISEAQERMTLAVPPDKLNAFMDLARKRDVLCTVLGHFTTTGFFHAVHGSHPVCYLDMEFLHNGLPQMELEAVAPPQGEDPSGLEALNVEALFLGLLSTEELSSRERLYRAYDHEVKGLSILKPFTGIRGDVHSDASVTGADYEHFDAIVLSEGVNPWYCELNPYAGTGAIIDEAVRKAVTAGADPAHMAGLDNFCWPDPVYHPETNPDGKEKLGALVESCRALAHFAPLYGAPCISGKDSMKNDAFLEGKKISIPYTLLFSVIARMPDYRKAVTPAPVSEGDILYCLGRTNRDFGGSAAFRYLKKKGGKVPVPPREGFLPLYEAYHRVLDAALVQSAHTPSRGGAALSLALQLLAGSFGLDVHLDQFLTGEPLTPEEVLFSESGGRIFMTLSPEQAADVEDMMRGLPLSRIGRVTSHADLRLFNQGRLWLSLGRDQLKEAYQRSNHGC
ncbi:MAG TPA: AIR synthase-related protein [Candidatus Mcinerneyibacteriales bacterium]|nr:AIR synthase-related protein [Candidatus Mcinerneyibacteriales bacterium]